MAQTSVTTSKMRKRVFFRASFFVRLFSCRVPPFNSHACVGKIPLPPRRDPKTSRFENAPAVRAAPIHTVGGRRHDNSRPSLGRVCFGGAHAKKRRCFRSEHCQASVFRWDRQPVPRVLVFRVYYIMLRSRCKASLDIYGRIYGHMI